MCLITKQTTPTILNEDLIVYKELKYIEGEIYSNCEDFPYELNKLYQTEIKKTTDLCYNDHIVEQYYNLTGFSLLGLKEEYKKQHLKSYGKGFHFYNSIERLNLSNEPFKNDVLVYQQVTVKCTIPKGSKVYFDDTELGVANQIILDEIVDAYKYL